MEDLSEFERALHAIRELFDAREYGNALQQCTELMDRWPGCAALHRYYARLVLLNTDDSFGPPAEDCLDHALESMKAAIMLAPDSVASQCDLAYHTYAVQDRTAEAKVMFESAIELATEQLQYAYVGLVKCLEELEETSRVTEVRGEIRRMFPDD